MKTPYPAYDVLAKWDSPSFDTVTRGVIRRRLEAVPERRFFTPAEFSILTAVAARLTAQGDGAELVPVAPWIDADLFEGRGPGFRHADLPPDRDVWRIGLAGVDAEAHRRYAQAFAELAADSQDAILRAVQAGEVAAESFESLPSPRVFTAMLGAVVGVYYAHPAAWSEIGFGGPASPRGYVRMGLDKRDPWEAPLSPGRRGS
ncbi:MAG: gluconate 2-dehydrogenase subunit 3 family protein [Caulobacterales bacterium]|jgi:hypothetical protein